MTSGVIYIIPKPIGINIRNAKMKTKITKLTLEQEAELPQFRQRYLDIACGGYRANRAELHTAITLAYAEIGKPEPKLFIFESPAACLIAIKIFEMGARDELKLGDNLGANLWANLRANLRANLGDNLWANLGDNLGDNRYMWGSQDLFWIAHYRFAQKIGCRFDERDARRLDIMERIATQCEWWWPFENIVIASERPMVVRRDERGRLHHDAGPAVEYADGYPLYVWHGTNIPTEWGVNRLTVNPSDILKHNNVEQRAAGLAFIGWARGIKSGAIPHKVIDRDPDPMHGSLIEIKLDGLPNPGRFLFAECPRNGDICEGVPANIQTVLEAQAWRVGLAPSEFSYPSVRT